MLSACSVQSTMQKSVLTVVKPENDSSAYELVIIDPDFDLWYIMKYSPALDRSEGTYQVQNRLGVLNWNSFYASGMFSEVIGSYIDYRPEISYGIELNRRLYWYFRFIEERHHIQLLH